MKRSASKAPRSAPRLAARVLSQVGLALASPASALLLLGFIASISAGLEARTPPGYADVEARLERLWRERYPIPAQSFTANPERLGLLTAVDGRRRVYYYHFRASVARPVRDEEGKIQYAEARELELWVRYRPWRPEDEAWDLSFARRDLLPGQDKRWIKR